MCLWTLDGDIEKWLMSALTTGCHPKLTIVGHTVFRDVLLATSVPNLLTLCLFSSVSSFHILSHRLKIILLPVFCCSSLPDKWPWPFSTHTRYLLLLNCHSFFPLNRINCAFVASLLKHIHRKNNIKVAEVVTWGKEPEGIQLRLMPCV